MENGRILSGAARAMSEPVVYRAGVPVSNSDVSQGSWRPQKMTDTLGPPPVSTSQPLFSLHSLADSVLWLRSWGPEPDGRLDQSSGFQDTRVSTVSSIAFAIPVP